MSNVRVCSRLKRGTMRRYFGRSQRPHIVQAVQNYPLETQTQQGKLTLVIESHLITDHVVVVNVQRKHVISYLLHTGLMTLPRLSMILYVTIDYKHTIII